MEGLVNLMEQKVILLVVRFDCIPCSLPLNFPVGNSHQWLSTTYQFIITFQGLIVTDKVALFRAFDLNNEGSLRFYQYLHGIAAMDPATPHGQLAG